MWCHLCWGVNIKVSLLTHSCQSCIPLRCLRRSLTPLCLVKSILGNCCVAGSESADLLHECLKQIQALGGWHHYCHRAASPCVFTLPCFKVRMRNCCDHDKICRRQDRSADEDFYGKSVLRTYSASATLSHTCICPYKPEEFSVVLQGVMGHFQSVCTSCHNSTAQLWAPRRPLLCVAR